MYYMTDCFVFLSVLDHIVYFVFFFFKQKTAYEMRISDWSSDVCSSDLHARDRRPQREGHPRDLDPRRGGALLHRAWRGLQGRACRQHPGGRAAVDLSPGQLADRKSVV